MLSSQKVALWSPTGIFYGVLFIFDITHLHLVRDTVRKFVRKQSHIFYEHIVVSLIYDLVKLFKQLHRSFQPPGGD